MKQSKWLLSGLEGSLFDGYWTSTTFDGSPGSVWCVSNVGTFTYTGMHANTYGVRPIVNLSIDELIQ